ncbi:hypothetical protein [Roseococcus microcysteis]|uniref:hypothetical protein n=1 Tax=Roseococcus microcysteis TaxID=2771361 RepID=UPI00168BC40E|nr:hypothetical protein [Roseococcus microcysteis]
MTPFARPRYARLMDETDDALERRLLAAAVAEAEAAPASADTPQALVRERLILIRDRLQARLGRPGAP